MIKLSFRAIFLSMRYARKFECSLDLVNNKIVFDDVDNHVTVYVIKVLTFTSSSAYLCVAQFKDNRFTRVLGIMSNIDMRYILEHYFGVKVMRLNHYMWFTVTEERFGNAQLYMLKDKILRRIDYDPSCILDQFVAEQNIFSGDKS